MTIKWVDHKITSIPTSPKQRYLPSDSYFDMGNVCASVYLYSEFYVTMTSYVSEPWRPIFIKFR